MEAARLADEQIPGRACGGAAPAAERLRRARAGEGSALRSLLDEIRDRILTLCFRLLGDRHEAEDATQEAMLRISLHLDELSSDAQFGSWCWRIAQRICLDRVRARTRRAELLARYREANRDDEERALLLRLLVRRLLADMPSDMSEVLILREMEGLSYMQVADTLGLPLGTVKSRLNAARRRFRDDYSKAGQEGEACSVKE